MKIALLGYGKMGRLIEQLALQAGDDIVLRVTAANRPTLSASELRHAEVAIEFSNPEAAFGNIALCLEAGIPVVSGTTGWQGRYEEAVALCHKKQGAMLWASNFSIGVNVLFALNQRLADLMAPHPGYDPVIEETHHIHKKDAPSGTAITLAEQIIKKLKRKAQWVLGTQRQDGDLLILAHREGEVPGTHLVRYSSPIDKLELKHEAHSREGFAAGALLAARWIIGKQGTFNMDDVLNLNAPNA
jgi:4-hydroxy-tetrahydrodipicolinate reductase